MMGAFRKKRTLSMHEEFPCDALALLEKLLKRIATGAFHGAPAQGRLGLPPVVPD
jgi:hypothetical protein